MMKYLFTALYILFTTSALFLMKAGGNSLFLSFKNGITFKIGFLTCIGFLLYICSFLLWQRLLVSFDLTLIVPITTGIVQIIVLLVGVLVFKEEMRFINVLGVLLVTIGLVLISIKR